MKTLFCSTPNATDLDKITQGQIAKLGGNSIELKIDPANNKASLLNALASIDDEIVLFVPPNNVLIEPPDFNLLNKIMEDMKERELDYVRLRRIGIHKQKSINEKLKLWQDTGNLFFLVPHVIKVSVLKDIASRIDSRDDMFWISMETTGYTGCYYFNPADQPDQKLSYWRSGVFHTLSDVLTPLDQWHENYIYHNDKVLASLLAEYNIDVGERGIGSIGGCCT